MWHHSMVHAILNTHLPSFDSRMANNPTTALIANAHLTHRRSSRVFRTIILKTAPKRRFLDTKSAVEWARRLKMQPNLFVVMRLGSLVVLSYLDAGFDVRCRRKDFWTTCCLLLAACCLLLAAAKTCCSSLDSKRWCKTSTWLTELGKNVYLIFGPQKVV